MRHIGLVAVASVLVAGCSNGLPGLRPLTYASPGEARVFASGARCVHEPRGKEFAGLAAALITGAASKLIANFGTALEKGAEGGNLPSSVAIQNLQLKPGAVPPCVIVIRGAFSPERPGQQPLSLESLVIAADDPARADQLVSLAALDLPPVYRLDHYLELKVEAAANHKALTFAPLFLRLERSIDGARSGKRDVSVQLKFTRLGAGASDGNGSAVLIADQRIGTTRLFERRKNGRFAHEAPWFGTFHQTTAEAAGTTTTGPPAATGGKTKPNGRRGRTAASAAPRLPVDMSVIGSGGTGVGGGGTVGQPGGGTIETQYAGADAVPVTVTSTVVETRPTREGLAFIASVFTGSQKEINQAIAPLISSTAAMEASNTELQAESDYATADAAARAAGITYCHSSSAEATAAGRIDRLNKSKDARTNQIKANIAAAKIDRSKPYPTLVVVSDLAPAEANAGACAGF